MKNQFINLKQKKTEKEKMSADDPRGGAFALSTFGLYEEKTRSVNVFRTDRTGGKVISETLLKWKVL